MSIEGKNYLYFNNLIKFIEGKTGKNNLSSLVREEIVESSKDYIAAHKVKPDLETSTTNIRRNRKRGVHTNPMLESGSLMNSIRATSKGIKFNEYGKYHRSGYTTAAKSMIPNKSVPPREFISFRASDAEKQKIISKIRSKFVKLVKSKLRKK